MYNRRDNALMQFKSYEQALNGNAFIRKRILLEMFDLFFNFHDFVILCLLSCFKDGQSQTIRKSYFCRYVEVS